MPTLNTIAPLFVVDDLQASLDFYRSKLGFEVTYTGGGNGEGKDFFGIVERDRVMIMLKAGRRFIRSPADTSCASDARKKGRTPRALKPQSCATPLLIV